MTTSFTRDLVADQIAVIELECALGEEFGIEILDATAEKTTTVKDAVRFINAVD